MTKFNDSHAGGVIQRYEEEIVTMFYEMQFTTLEISQILHLKFDYVREIIKS